MVGRKLSFPALAVSLAAVAFAGACRDDATTGPTRVPSKVYASNIKLLGGDLQTGAVALPLAQSLTAKVVDAGGRPVQGASVNWVVTGGGGSVNPPTGISDANGMVGTSWTLGTELGANEVKAFLTGSYVLDSIKFTANAIAGAPVVIRVNTSTRPPATAQVASALSPISFTILDQFGHPVPGATVTFTPGLNSGSVNPAVAISDEDGVVTTVWTTGTTAGLQTLQASIQGQLPITATLNATPDTSRTLTTVSGDNQTTLVSTPFATDITVRVTDQYGNVIKGDLVTFNIGLENGATVNPTTMVSDAAGIATTRWSPGAKAGPQQMFARIAGSGGQIKRITGTTQVVFRDVFAGDYYVCGVTSSDRSYCWGFGEDGQLGTFALVNRNAPNWPVAAQGGDTLTGPYPTFRDVSGGKSHACGVAIARTIYCWGFNPDRRQFIEPNGRNAKAIDISAAGNQALNPLMASTLMVGTGESFSCAITLGGIALCAGGNEVGQLGVGAPGGTIATSLVDTTQPPAGKPQRYASIAVGERHACGMPRFDPTSPATTLASRTPWCWGGNGSGQLGDGPASTYADSARPNPISMPAPAAAAGGFETTSLVAGASHTCALTPVGIGGGAAYCWGSNQYGQLGAAIATGAGARSATPVAVSGGQLFMRLYAGQNHTCGLTVAGTAFCWGINTSGQLGSGAVSALQATPVAVAGGLAFRNLALGELHTCGITGAGGPGPQGTTGSAGILYCWGDNEYGQLGQNSFGANAAPVSSPLRVSFQQ